MLSNRSRSGQPRDAIGYRRRGLAGGRRQVEPFGSLDDVLWHALAAVAEQAQ